MSVWTSTTFRTMEVVDGERERLEVTHQVVRAKRMGGMEVGLGGQAK